MDGGQKRPSVGAHAGELFPEVTAEKRENSKATRSIERIEVAASGEMAWEFSYGKLEYDDAAFSPSHHVSFEQGILRVWKKVNGEWRVAASFIRPLDEPFMPASGK